MVLPEVQNASARKAIAVTFYVGYYSYRRPSMAVHEFNKDGTPSKKGPYWVKLGTWKPTGVKHVVTVLETKGDFFFSSSNPYQKSSGPNGIRRYLIKITEFNTVKYWPMELSEYVQMKY